MAAIDLETLKTLWTRHIPGFNLGEPLAVGDSIYITALGFIGGASLKTGKFLWQYDGLYGSDDQAFNSFQKPQLQGGKIIFTEQAASFSKRQPYQITVHPRSGIIYKNTRPK